MKCQRCDSERVLVMATHSRDCHAVQYGDAEGNGYAPKGFPFCHGDGAWFKICLECGQLQGEWPVVMTDEEIIEALEEM